MKYKSYNLRNFREIEQIGKLPDGMIKDIEVVSRVLPFKTNNYVVDELIDWDNFRDDPMFILNESSGEFRAALCKGRLKREGLLISKKTACKFYVSLQAVCTDQAIFFC